MNTNTATLAQLQWPIAPPRSADADGSTAHYVITLTTAPLPIRDALPRLPAFAEARVFCERYEDAGTVRIRVQLGYFRSVRAAAEALRIVRAEYPCAAVRGVRLPHEPRHSAAHGVAAPDGAAAPVRGTPHLASVTGTRDDARAAAGFRRFAVELLWSPQPIDLTHVPPLTMFDGYTLYAVSAHRGGHDWHRLQLGFFTDRATAMAAVDEATTYFADAIAVPVTDSEFDQASEAEIRPFAARIGVVSFAPT